MKLSHRLINQSMEHVLDIYTTILVSAQGIGFKELFVGYNQSHYYITVASTHAIDVGLGPNYLWMA